VLQSKSGVNFEEIVLLTNSKLHITYENWSDFLCHYLHEIFYNLAGCDAVKGMTVQRL